jgi:hypothetical protein
MNFDLQVKDIKQETFILISKINDEELIKNLIDFVKNNKDEKLSNNTHVKGHFTGFKSLNNNENFIKFINLIRLNILTVYKKHFKVGDAWGNICKINEEVTEHSHWGTTAFCGILYLTNTDHYTYFREYDLKIKDEIGKFVLFHPMLLHSVPKVTTDIERITVAFNMDEIKEWDINKFKVI